MPKGADWNAQAVLSAQAYLNDGMGFSRNGLIEQLVSGEGFHHGAGDLRRDQGDGLSARSHFAPPMKGRPPGRSFHARTVVLLE